LRLGCAYPEQIVGGLDLELSSLFSSTLTGESRDNRTSLGSSSKVSPGQYAEEGSALGRAMEVVAAGPIGQRPLKVANDVKQAESHGRTLK
jgi:hypothetical protein